LRYIPRYRIDVWSPYAFADDTNGRFCEYRYYQELASVNTWQSVDTAPLDRPILLFWSALNTPVVAEWKKDQWVMCVTGVKVNPTHWAELPENPL
jgi:hypothetical protein